MNIDSFYDEFLAVPYFFIIIFGALSSTVDRICEWTLGGGDVCLFVGNI